MSLDILVECNKEKLLSLDQSFLNFFSPATFSTSHWYLHLT